MEYTMDDIKAVLGDKYNPDAEYVLETKRGSTNKFMLGWKPVGEVNDSTDNPKGVMVIMEAPTKEGV
jgi:hypothetical protein